MHANDSDNRLPALTLAALGVVYGDIGTSPLYAMKEVFGGAHHPVPITPDNILGILSLIFWSRVGVVSVNISNSAGGRSANWRKAPRASRRGCSRKRLMA